jgi:hypothetical protein
VEEKIWVTGIGCNVLPPLFRLRVLVRGHYHQFTHCITDRLSDHW